MGGKGGGGGDSVAYVKHVPPWAEDEVAAYAQQAYDLWQGSTISSYTGDIIAAQTTNELEGIDGLATRGRYGDQVITKAIAYLEKVINGEFLEGTEAAFLLALSETLTGAQDGFNNEVYPLIGRKPYYVGDSDPSYLAQTLAVGFPATYNARTQAAIYAENFGRERGLQQHGLGFGVEMGKHAAIDAEALRRAGLYVREYLQSTYVLEHKLFVEAQEVNVVKLEIFGNCLRALTGSSQKTTKQGPEQNKMMSAVGGAVVGGVAGWYIGAEIGAVGGPLGMVIGAAVGGLVGWFL